MLLKILSKVVSRSNCILILVMFNLVISVPLKSRKPSPNEQGFSASPRILEIQLPLKITSKEDLIAWSKYVMSLVASKINLTTSKDAQSIERRTSDNSKSRLKETMKKPLNDKRQGLNYPVRRLKEPHMQRGDEKVVAYPLPIGGMKMTTGNPQASSAGLPASNIDGLTGFEQFANFDIGNTFPQSEFDTFGNLDLLTQPPAATYLPLPLRTSNVLTYHNTNKNISGFKEPAKLQTKKKSMNHRIKNLNNKHEQILPIDVNDGLIGRNQSHLGEPLLTFPFQAVITITRQLPAATSISKTQLPKDYFAIRTRDPPDEFPPYFEKNHTITNESGQINVVLNDFIANPSGTRLEEDMKEKEKENDGQKKKSEKTTKGAKKQNSRKRQSSALGDLLRMLGILRKLPKNTTEINVATPVLSILKGTNAQKIQVVFEETVPNRGRRNETFQAQQVNGNDDDEEEDEQQQQVDEEEDEQQQQQDDDDDEDEEEGGSIQALIDLLPLAAPLLEDLSDPESDINIAEVLQSAIPLLEGLSDPNEEGALDIPGVLVPLFQRLSQGQDGQGSDFGAILGPLIQLVAPLIGPLVGPLIGPLSRTISGPGGKEGSASLITSVAGPLSEPQGPYGQSILSSLVASITAKLSKELAASAGDSDVKSLVSSIVAGVLAGTSAGSSGHKTGYKTGQKDTYQAPTTYGGYTYNTHQAPSGIGDTISASIKEILGAFLKLSATGSTSGANLSGTSSSAGAGLSTSSSESKEPPKETPTYSYGPLPSQRPTYAVPTNSPYASYTRRQSRQKIKKF